MSLSSLASLSNIAGFVKGVLLDIFSILGKKPGFVADFDGEYYRAAGSSTTFSGAITHAATSNATMTDSDGYIKWRPHNTWAYSEQFDISTWVKGELTVSANAAVAPDGTTTADLLVPSTNNTQHYVGQGTGALVGRVSLYAKAGGYRYLQVIDAGYGRLGTLVFDLQTGTVSDDPGNVDASIQDVGNGWYFISARSNDSGQRQTTYRLAPSDVSTGGGDYAGTVFVGDGTSGIYVWGAHVYRTDLGGMVDNPDRGDSYVPTTSAAVYLPRRGHHIYDGVSAWVNEGVLHESEARTNLITYSAEFDNAAWIKTRSSISADAVAGPDGQTTADKLVEDSSPSNDHFIRFAVGDTAAPWTASFYVKAAERDRIITWVSNTGYLGFDLSTGAQEGAVGSNVTDYGIDDVGNGWYRIWFYSSTVSTGTNFNIGLYDSAYVSGFPTYSGDGSSGAYIWGAQVEAGATPSSYIPTSGATATRAAETLTIPSANLPWSGTAASIQMDGRMTYADDGTAASVAMYRWYIDANNRLGGDISGSAGGTGALSLYQVASGVVDTVLGTVSEFTPGVNVPFNIASRHGSTFINGAVDGVALTANTTPTALPDLSSTDLLLGYVYMGTIRTFRVWNVDLTDAGIEEAST